MSTSLGEIVTRTIAVALTLGLSWTAPGTEAVDAGVGGAEAAVKEAERARNGGDPERAVRILESALAECGAEKACQAKLLVGRCEHAWATGDTRAALALCEQALPMWRELDDRRGEAEALNDIGVIYGTLGQKQKALEYYERALSLRREVGDRSGEALALNNIGAVYGNLGQNQKAREYYELALTIQREVDDRSGEATTLNNVGELYDALGQKQEALESYERALSTWRELGNRNGEATELANIGLVYYSLGQMQKALENTDRALPIFREVRNRSGEAGALNNLAGVYYSLGQMQKALESFERTLPIFSEIGERNGEAAVLNNLGGIYDALGRKQKALESYERALSMRREMGDRSGEAQTLTNIGSVYADLGQKQKALEYYEGALPMLREVGARDIEANTLNSLGSIYGSVGQKQKALEYYERALPMWRELEDRSGEATTLNNFGYLYSELGQKQKALEYYDRALAIRREVRDRSGEAQTLANIGSVYDDLGQKQKALEYYEQALPILREVEDRSGTAAALNNMGGLYQDLGQKQKALQQFQLALAIVREVGDRSSEATTLNNIGSVYDDLGQKQKALENLERALPILREVGNRSGEANTLNNIGTVSGALGQRQKALENYELALTIQREVGDRAGEANTLTNFGNLYGDLGQKQKALEYYELALPIRREVGDRSGEATALGNSASAVQEVSPERAVFHAKQAVNILQSLRDDVGGDKKLQRSFANSISDTYRFVAQLLAREDRIAEAQEVMDLLKGDEMGRLLRRSAPAGGRISLNPAEAALDETYGKLTEALGALNAEAGELRRKKTLSAEEQQHLAALEQKVGSAEAELKAFFDGIAGTLARTGAKQASPGQARELAVLAEGLPSGTVAVYTIAGENNLTTILYTQDDHAVREVRVTSSDLGKAVSVLREALSKRRGNVEAAGARLYQLLVAPLAEKLESSKATTIVWSLDGPLRYVPLAVLRDAQRKKWLVEEYRNVVLSTASHTGPTTAPAEWTALGVGVTKAHGGLNALAGVEAELAAVVRDERSKQGAIPGLRLLDESFTRQALEKELKEHRPVLHIASHYVFEPPTNEAAANGSYLLLGDGSHLTLKELDAMPEETFGGVDLLTLSACDTANGAEDRPELEGAEVDGLAFVARQKGADAVMATLWSVNDASTSAFMAELYRRRAEGKKSKAEALQETQLAFLQGKVKPRTGGVDRGVEPVTRSKARDWTHPYHWAPFILIGNWM